jgi:hypothetical protein
LKAKLINFFNALPGMHAYVLPEPEKEVKGLFVAVPQIDRNRTAHPPITLKPNDLGQRLNPAASLAVTRNVQ